MAQPHFIELDEAVSRIKQACDDRANDSHSPFFFMVGAGLSCPSVPLAPEIVSKCKEVAKRYGRGDESTERKGLDNYSYWFQTAYDEPKQRQKYLHDLIRGKPLTHASFRLAHLLLSKKISNLVVTTNFDDFLTKALTLFGEPHIVCDHPQTVGRINHSDPLLQIVHLHGSYWFYDCCNLRGELEQRAQQSQQTTSTMASLLNVILWDRSPLIIGYSGWEGDVFMEALKRRLATPLSSNVYWFCYSKTMVDSLPAWARESPNIRFVVATPRPVTKQESNVSEQTSDSQPLPGAIQAKSLGVKKDEEAVLPADTVLHRLIQAFNLEAPELTKDPLGFFAKRLQDSLPTSDASDVATDIYAIKSVIERVRIAKEREGESGRTHFRFSESTLEDVRDALRRADFREAVKRAANLSFNVLDEKGLDELAESMWVAAGGLLDSSEEELSAYDLIVRVWDEQQRREIVANGVIKTKVAKALAFKGISLGTLQRRKEEVAAYDEVIERFGDADEFEVREQVADTLFNKATSFEEQGYLSEAIVVYDQIVERYRDATETELQVRAARALLRKAANVGDLGRLDEEFQLYDLVIKQYGPKSNLQSVVGLALFGKAFVLSELNRGEEAMALYDQIVTEYGDSQEPEMIDIASKARFNKCLILTSMNRREEALAICNGIIEAYGTAPDPALQEVVARTFNSMAYNLIILAKAARLQGDAEAALAKLNEAEVLIIKSLAKEEDRAVKLGNHAYIAFLLGRKDDARRLLTEAITLGGDKIRHGELSDAYINELPEDAEFRAMVAAVPSVD